MTFHPTSRTLTQLPANDARCRERADQERAESAARALSLRDTERCSLEDQAALILGETSCSLAAAAKLFPPGKNGRSTHPTTLVRWITRGVQGVRLEAVRVGGRWVTSPKACQRFAALLTAQHNASKGPPGAALLSGAVSQPRQERVERALQEIGL